jgi:cytochrome c553
VIRLKPYVVGAAFGVAAIALLPLAGLWPHGTGGPDPAGWHRWIAARQSVTLRSLTVVPPELDDAARAMRGAGHYALVCADCHGSPAGPAERFALDLLPPPPPLVRAADRWRPDARVFQTVLHGIRNSAMPGWPSEVRQDEVWDMVAFLRVMPDLSAEEYRRMAGEAGDCAHCHGESGEGRAGMPRLDILSAAYVAAALEEYRAGVRPSGTMMAVARGLTDEGIARLATAFGREVDVGLPEDDGSHGAALALRGDAVRDIPACLSCHETGDAAVYPGIVGQEAEYLTRQLHLFVPEEPGADPVRQDPRAEIMAEAVRELEPEDIEAVVEWLAGAGE